MADLLASQSTLLDPAPDPCPYLPEYRTLVSARSTSADRYSVVENKSITDFGLDEVAEAVQAPLSSMWRRDCASKVHDLESEPCKSLPAPKTITTILDRDH